MDRSKTIVIDSSIMKNIQQGIKASLRYEESTGWKRKLGITGEVGEVLACHLLKLKLVRDSRSEGFDAIDKGRLKVQIKTRRPEDDKPLKGSARVSPFSKYKFDYTLLVVLDRQYRVSEIYRVSYKKLIPEIEKHKKRNPNISFFINKGVLVYPKI